MLCVRAQRGGGAERWPSWAAWRRAHAVRRPVAPPAPASADWCPTCSGNGRLFAFARNGEGLIPVGPCESCLGTGQAAAASLLRLQAGDDTLRRARAVLLRALDAAGWAADEAGRVILAAGEAVVNAVEHGSLPAAAIEVRFVASATRAVVRVVDAGRPGSVLHDGALSLPVTTSERGRGLLLTCALADSFALSRVGGGTAVLLEFWRRRMS
jgi:anti-sigma regulatory factor (Ser/Thr protein kinase)